MGGVEPFIHHEGYFETLLGVLSGIVKDFIGYLFSLNYCCFIFIEI